MEGEFEELSTLEETLGPLLEREVGPHFLAWGIANETALAEARTQTELEMDGQLYYQRTFRYPASTLGILRRRFEHARGGPELSRLLRRTGCLAALERDAGGGGGE